MIGLAQGRKEGAVNRDSCVLIADEGTFYVIDTKTEQKVPACQVEYNINMDVFIITHEGRVSIFPRTDLCMVNRHGQSSKPPKKNAPNLPESNQNS